MKITAKELREIIVTFLGAQLFAMGVFAYVFVYLVYPADIANALRGTGLGYLVPSLEMRIHKILWVAFLSGMVCGALLALYIPCVIRNWLRYFRGQRNLGSVSKEGEPPIAMTGQG